MTVGMFMAGLAFVAAALVQIQIDNTLPNFPSSSESQIKFLNLRDIPLQITTPNHDPLTLQPFQATPDYLTFVDNETKISTGENSSIIILEKGIRQTLLIKANTMEQIDDLTAKPEQGYNGIRFVNGLSTTVNVTGTGDFGTIAPSSVSNYTLLHEGTSNFRITNQDGKNCEFSMTFGFGSSYTLVIPSTVQWENCGDSIEAVQDITPNTIHMAWQIPQYFLMTCGEVVFSVTGLEFSYSQAPSNMKSVLQAGWLFTVAVGNIIVLIVAEAVKLPKQWAEYILFAALLMAVCVVFAWMAHFYTYVDPNEIEAQFHRDNFEKDNEKQNMKEEKDSICMEKKDNNEEVKQTKV